MVKIDKVWHEIATSDEKTWRRLTYILKWVTRIAISLILALIFFTVSVICPTCGESIGKGIASIAAFMF